MSNKRFYVVLALIFLTSLTGLSLSGNTVNAQARPGIPGVLKVQTSPEQAYTGLPERGLTHSLAYMLGFSLGSAVVENLNPNQQVRARAPKSYSEAQTFGQAFGVVLPALPKYSGNLGNDTAAAVNYVFYQAVPLIKRAMDQKDESEIDSAHFSFAVMTPLAATFYDPRDSDKDLTGTFTTVLQQAGRKTGLPSNIWREPVALLERRAPVDQVARSLQATARKVVNYYGVR